MVFIVIIMIIKWKRLCLFLFFFSRNQNTTGGSITQQDVEHIPLDGVLELLPDPSSIPDNITGILWKFGPNKVAGFGPDVDIYEDYGTYKNRSKLDKETGMLVVNNMTKDDSGNYSVEINGKLQDKTYMVEVHYNSAPIGSVNSDSPTPSSPVANGKDTQSGVTGVAGDHAQQDVKHIPVDGVLQLVPDPSSVTDNITGILWKFGSNKVAEWDRGFGPDVDFYGTYKNRTELDKETGKLVVNNLTKHDSGEYSVEVNGKLQSETYMVEVHTADPPEDSNVTSTAEHQNISSSPTPSSPTPSSPTSSPTSSTSASDTLVVQPPTTATESTQSKGLVPGLVLLVIIILATIVLCGILYYLRRTSRTYSFDLQRPGPENHAPFTDHAGTFEPIHLEDLDNSAPVGSVNSDSPTPSSPVANGKDTLSGVTGVGGDHAPSGDVLVVMETPPISSVTDLSLDVDAIDVTLDQPGDQSGVSFNEQKNTNNNNPLGSSQCFVEVSLEEPAWNDLHVFPSPNPTSSVLPFCPFSLSSSSLPQQTIG